MTEQEIQGIIARQRAYYASGATHSRKARKEALLALRRGMKKYEAALTEALQTDLGKSAAESYMCEIGLTYSEISWMLGHLRRLMRDRWHCTPLALFPAVSYQSPSPYGTVLVVSPWNYPVLLTLEPLVDALAAGNTVVLKPSAYAPHCAAVLQQLIADCFRPEQVAVVTGGRAENQALLRQRWDLIFFTGGKTVGREVMRQAAEHLTPAVLELGGKSPVIIDASADIASAARRVVFGKYLNCGQTCVAPDYILCHRSVHDRFVEAMKQEITTQYGAEPLQNEHYGKIINQKHFERLCGLIDPDKVVVGGQTQPDRLRIAPTVMVGVTPSDAIMQEEIFGPILPILTFDALDEAIDSIEAQPHPLALYLFAESRQVQRTVMNRCHFGGGCINDVIVHLATSEIPFGGVGESGMGSYHGRQGFETFSHLRSMQKKPRLLDLPIRYQPYSNWKERLLKMFLR
ncbi:MAG: aldehyde dehydrogenase [Bacteroidaceae bacterium]|nr:aldehyde dehydrogenase [Bacteroidaceae bacterium]